MPVFFFSVTKWSAEIKTHVCVIVKTESFVFIPCLFPWTETPAGNLQFSREKSVKATFFTFHTPSWPCKLSVLGWVPFKVDSTC